MLQVVGIKSDLLATRPETPPKPLCFPEFMMFCSRLVHCIHTRKYGCLCWPTSENKRTAIEQCVTNIHIDICSREYQYKYSFSPFLSTKIYFYSYLPCFVNLYIFLLVFVLNMETEYFCSCIS